MKKLSNIPRTEKQKIRLYAAILLIITCINPIIVIALEQNHIPKQFWGRWGSLDYCDSRPNAIITITANTIRPYDALCILIKTLETSDEKYVGEYICEGPSGYFQEIYPLRLKDNMLNHYSGEDYLPQCKDNNYDVEFYETLLPIPSEKNILSQKWVYEKK